jgi:ubiquinone/menaquinone biosynthesis C-methylase UbiE
MALPFADQRNATEIAYWNGAGGQRWLARERTNDRLLGPVGERLMERLSPRPGEFVLDIGCGCGASTIALARQVAPNGHVLGVDVSALLLERARELVPAGLAVEFVLGDASIYPFEAGHADLLFSRFGVMFFADPARAFANIRAGLRPGARVGFACWRAPRENPWFMLPLQAAYRHVPRLPEPGPEDPGPFSFASERRVRDILERAGFGAIQCEPVELVFDLAEGRGLDVAVETSLGIGPAGRALEGQPPALRTAAAESIRAALAPYQDGGRLPLRGAIWVVSCTNF